MPIPAKELKKNKVHGAFLAVPSFIYYLAVPYNLQISIEILKQKQIYLSFKIK